MADAVDTATERADSAQRRLRHGYPPPELAPGSRTTSYCGQPMVVEGAYTSAPPADACPMCVLVWQQRNGE